MWGAKGLYVYVITCKHSINPRTTFREHGFNDSKMENESVSKNASPSLLEK